MNTLVFVSPLGTKATFSVANGDDKVVYTVTCAHDTAPPTTMTMAKHAAYDTIVYLTGLGWKNG